MSILWQIKDIELSHCQLAAKVKQSSIGPSKCGTEWWPSAHIQSGRACMSWSGRGLLLFSQSKAFQRKSHRWLWGSGAIPNYEFSCIFFLMNTIDSAIRNWLMSLISREKMDCVLVKILMPKKKKKSGGDMLAIFVLINKHGIFYCNLIKSLLKSYL